MVRKASHFTKHIGRSYMLTSCGYRKWIFVLVGIVCTLYIIVLCLFVSAFQIWIHLLYWNSHMWSMYFFLSIYEDVEADGGYVWAWTSLAYSQPWWRESEVQPTLIIDIICHLWLLGNKSHCFDNHLRLWCRFCPLREENSGLLYTCVVNPLQCGLLP